MNRLRANDVGLRPGPFRTRRDDMREPLSDGPRCNRHWKPPRRIGLVFDRRRHRARGSSPGARLDALVQHCIGQRSVRRQSSSMRSRRPAAIWAPTWARAVIPRKPCTTGSWTRCQNTWAKVSRTGHLRPEASRPP